MENLIADWRTLCQAMVSNVHICAEHAHQQHQQLQQAAASEAVAAQRPVLALQLAMPKLSLRLAAAEDDTASQSRSRTLALRPPLLRAWACGLTATLAVEGGEVDLRWGHQVKVKSIQVSSAEGGTLTWAGMLGEHCAW